MVTSTKEAYESAKELYKKIGVDSDAAIKALEDIEISIHCWQGDDVSGFEGGSLTGGIQATGNYPGRAKTADELRGHLEKVLSLVPGKYKVNLHAIYAETDGNNVPRNELKPKHFEKWVKWAKEHDLGLDFNGTFFSHPLSDDGFTLSHSDERIRAFWIEHGKSCQKIGEYFGKETGKKCIVNIWIPDGYKDTPYDRLAPRIRLKDSLDKIIACPVNHDYVDTAVESKVFGIGSEAYVVGSHEFYMGYAMANNILLCLDTGHFHPTELVADKISSTMLYVKELLLHVSRPMRWDSDHVVSYNDDLLSICHELVRNNFLDRTHISLDFFDASINRIAAWVIGIRNTKKALLSALLEPHELLNNAEIAGDYTTRLVLLEEEKSYPIGSVWDYYCEKNNVPVREEWFAGVKEFEKKENR